MFVYIGPRATREPPTVDLYDPRGTRSRFTFYDDVVDLDLVWRVEDLLGGAVGVCAVELTALPPRLVIVHGVPERQRDVSFRVERREELQPAKPWLVLDAVALAQPFDERLDVRFSDRYPV